VVKRLDRSREHFLTLLQLRARSSGLAITNVPNSRHCDIPPQEPQCPAPFHFRFRSIASFSPSADDFRGRDASYLAPTGSPEAVARPRSGRIEARTRLRMMLTFPRSPLSFRTAGFPRYGWKAGFQMVPSRLPRELKSAPDIRGALASLHPSFVHLVVQQLSRTVSGR